MRNLLTSKWLDYTNDTRLVYEDCIVYKKAVNYLTARSAEEVDIVDGDSIIANKDREGRFATPSDTQRGSIWKSS